MHEQQRNQYRVADSIDPDEYETYGQEDDGIEVDIVEEDDGHDDQYERRDGLAETHQHQQIPSQKNNYGPDFFNQEQV
jgi:hypothetical protein